jgi:hypothetical protein
LSRILHVHYEDGSEQKFGVPDGWQVPALIDHMDWLVLPIRDGEQASIALQLRDVKWLSASNELVDGAPAVRSTAFIATPEDYPHDRVCHCEAWSAPHVHRHM